MALGSLNFNDARVTVIGGGIAGLLAAHYLDRAGFEVTLREASPRVGGLISTVRTPYGIAESAAHSVLATSKVREHFQELGIELVGVVPDARSKFIVRDGQIRRFPLNLFETLEAVLRACFLPVSGHAADSTILEWADRHLGKAGLNYLIAPFLTGVFASLPSEMDLRTAFPSLHNQAPHTLVSGILKSIFQREGESGPQMMAPRYGMGSWVEALDRHLQNRLKERMILNYRISALPTEGNIVLCVPADEAAELLMQASAETSEALRRVRYTPIVCATVFVSRSSLMKLVKGVGLLVPPAEGREILGILFNSIAYPNRVSETNLSVSFTVMLGGSLRADLLDAPDSTLKDIIQRELEHFFRLVGKPLHFSFQRWKKGIPQYSKPLAEAWAVARKSWCSQPGRILFGNYTGQVSLRGMIEDAQSFSIRPKETKAQKG